MIESAEQLAAALGVDDVAEIEDALYGDYGWDDEVVLLPEGLELLRGTVGTVLNYPFRLEQIAELIADLEHEP